jgi:hypothetical protein
MSKPSPIDELSGYEFSYIRRGLSQLELLIGIKDRQIIKLDQQLAISNFENNHLRENIMKLNKKIAEFETLAKNKKLQDEFDRLFDWK